MHRRTLLLGALALPLTGCSFLKEVARVFRGDYVVVWQDNQDGRVRTRGYKSASHDVRFATFQVSPSSLARQPSVAAFRDGFVVVWIEKSNWSVLAKGFNLDGSTRFDVKTVDQNVPWDGGTPGDGSFPWHAPRIAMASDGSFVVCWDLGSGWMTRARRYLVDGTAMAPIDVAPASSIFSDVAMANDGSFAVTYTSGNKSFVRGFNPEARHCPLRTAVYPLLKKWDVP